MKGHLGPGYGPEDLMNIDISALLPVILPIIGINVILILMALIDLYKHRKTRNHARLWTFIILIVSIIGPILYFTVGRKEMK